VLPKCRAGKANELISGRRGDEAAISERKKAHLYDVKSGRLIEVSQATEAGKA